MSFSKTQALIDQLLGVEISRGAHATIRRQLSAALAEPMAQALEAARQQPVAYVDKTGHPPAIQMLAILRTSAAGSGSWSPPQ